MVQRSKCQVPLLALWVVDGRVFVNGIISATGGFHPALDIRSTKHDVSLCNLS